MKFEITLSLPNSIVMVMDRASGIPPTTFLGKLVAFTDTCVAVGTISEHDGATKLQFADLSDPEIITDKYLAFDGKIDVEGKHVSLVNAYNEELLHLPVKAKRVGVQIWVNDLSEPNCIGVIIS